jgi:hypothetical protein
MKIHNNVMRARTGQDPILSRSAAMGDTYVAPDGSTYVRQAPYYPPQNGGQPCGPPLATQLRSHGSACPPPGCDLATGLGRYYSDAGTCRELTYWVFTTAASSTFQTTVTMCPTRIVIVEEIPTFGRTLDTLVFGNQNQMVGDPLPLLAFAPDAVQAIPWVTDCIKSGQQVSFTIGGTAPAEGNAVWLGFVGPMIG